VKQAPDSADTSISPQLQEETMLTYAVTGASGKLGRLAAQELMSRGVPGSAVVAVVRTPSKAADLAERGVRVREADYARLPTLAGALEGVDRLLLVSSSEPRRRVAHHANVIAAARTAARRCHSRASSA
jgi:NAD(P)H dehydrogenase (quinone)